MTECYHGMRKRAQLSKCGAFRYTLERNWSGDDSAPYVCWIMLNPSTADHVEDDPTIQRCIKFTKRWSFERLLVVNLYPLRTPHPSECKEFAQWDQGGPDWWARDQILYANLPIVVEKAAKAARIIVAWGANAWQWDDGFPEHVLEEIATETDTQPECLGVTKDGSPKHPLARGKHRVPDDFEPVPWPIRAAATLDV